MSDEHHARPAPPLSDAQLDTGIGVLQAVLAEDEKSTPKQAAARRVVLLALFEGRSGRGHRTDAAALREALSELRHYERIRGRRLEASEDARQVADGSRWANDLFDLYEDSRFECGDYGYPEECADCGAQVELEHMPGCDEEAHEEHGPSARKFPCIDVTGKDLGKPKLARAEER